MSDAFELLYGQLEKEFRFTLEKSGLSEEEVRACAEGKNFDEFRLAIDGLMSQKRKRIRERMSTHAKVEYALNIAYDLITGRHITWSQEHRTALQELVLDLTPNQKNLAIQELSRQKLTLTETQIRSALDAFEKTS